MGERDAAAVVKIEFALEEATGWRCRRLYCPGFRDCSALAIAGFGLKTEDTTLTMLIEHVAKFSRGILLILLFYY